MISIDYKIAEISLPLYDEHTFCLYILCVYLNVAMHNDPLGRAAMDEDNLFYYLTHPGCINLKSIDDAR